jgi:polyisoprenoid-binding protein YceI
MRLLIIGLLCLAAVTAMASDWRMRQDSTLTFESTFEGAPLPGRFGRFDVALDFDPQDPGAGTLQVTVDLAGADMGDPDMNEAIAGRDWFHIAGFPQAVYESSDIEASGPGEFVAHGELVLKGIRRSVDVPFTWSEAGESAQMRGELTLKRSDFNIGSGEWAGGEQIGIGVRLQFALELERVD